MKDITVFVAINSSHCFKGGDNMISASKKGGSYEENTNII